MQNPALGLWYCELVDQEQSEDEADEFGEYDDGFDRQQKASKTEFANATLELFEDGRYELKAQDYNSSHGTWSEATGQVSLTEADDCTNGYDGLEGAYGDGERFTVRFKLNPDSHDGLDILILSFGRNAPKQASSADGFVDQLLAAEDQGEVFEIIGKFGEERSPAELSAELWDAWVEGRFAADPEADHYWLETQALADDQIAKGGGFGHRHAKHAFETLDPNDTRELFDTVVDALALLPEDPTADAELAPLLAAAANGAWLARMSELRFIGGGLPEELFGRPLMLQPQTDEAARASLSKSGYYTVFEPIEQIYPAGHEDLAKIVIRYRGTGMLELPLALIERRNIRAEAKAAALAWLEDPKTNKASEVGLNAMMFALVLLVEDGEPLPEILIEALGVEIRHGILGRCSNEENAKLRSIAAKLPEAQRALVHKRFGLDPKA